VVDDFPAPSLSPLRRERKPLPVLVLGVDWRWSRREVWVDVLDRTVDEESFIGEVGFMMGIV
jgi:hypothetical protein